MLDKGIFRALKQSNVSKDLEKTKQRVRVIWKSTPLSQKEEVLALAGITASVVPRTYKLGTISAKLVAAMSQIMLLDPYYLTGVVDEQRKYSDDLLIQFLTEHGYGNIITIKSKIQSEPASASVATKSTTKKTTGVTKNYAEPTTDTKIAKGNDLVAMAKKHAASLSTNEKNKLDRMTEEEISLLTTSLLIRAKFNKDVRDLVTLMKLIIRS